MRVSFAVLRRASAAAFAVLAFVFVAPARAATPAEGFIAANIHKGLAILDDTGLTQDQRRAQFEQFLLGVTDLKRVATFTLGQYAASAAPADRDAFAVAFQRYAVAVYQSYFERYTGQSLTVTGSRANGPNDDIVATTLVDPNARDARPLEVDFRVRSDTGAPTIVDFNVAGVWLAPAERDEFTAYLGRNNGSVPALVAYLDQLRGKIAARN